MSPKGTQTALHFLIRPTPIDFQIERLQGRERFGVALGPPFLAEQPDVLRARRRRVLAGLQEGAMLLLADRVDRFRHLANC